METTKDDVLRYIFNNERINKLIASYCLRNGIPDLENDFKSFLYLQLYNSKDDKLVDTYNRGKIDNYVWGAIHKQIVSSTSPFYTQYRQKLGKPRKKKDKEPTMFGIINNGSSNFVDTEDYEYQNLSIEDDYDDETWPPSGMVQDANEELSNFETYEEFSKREADRVRDIVSRLPMYPRQLWKMMFVEGLTYSEIARKTGIKYNTVNENIHNTLDKIKNIYREMYPEEKLSR